MKARFATIISAVGLAGTLAAAPSTSAAQVLYTDRSLWELAVLGITNLDFSGLASPGSFTTVPTPYDGVTFSGPAVAFDAVDPAYGPAFYDWGTGPVMWVSASIWTMSFGPGVRAVGLSFGSYAPSVFSFSINGGVALGPYAGGSNPDWAFFGLTSDTDISSIEVETTGDPFAAVPVYDDISYSVVATTPEPSSLILLGTGIAGVAGIVRRRKARRG